MKTRTMLDQLLNVQEQIATSCARSGRKVEDVTLIAVSKKQPIEAILTLYEAGIRHFGENRLEEADVKIPQVNAQVNEPPVWHMIGHIQSRKAKYIQPLFDVVHSVDSLKIARKLSQFAQENHVRLPVLLEINISGEDAKYGFNAYDWSTHIAVKDELWHNIEQLTSLEGLDIRGLMTMAPYVDDIELTRPVFAGLAQLSATLQQDFGIALPDLSMGMTNDYPVAIEEGATMVRIGRALFS